MRISFYGAAGEVTGSCYLVETDRARILVDFGMHQGSAMHERKNARMPPIDPPRLNAVCLTHGHLDHCGRLPLLSKFGYRGAIHATEATCELTEIILRDSAKIQEYDAERRARKRGGRGRGGGRHKKGRSIAPLYTQDDVDPILEWLNPIGYDQDREVAPGIRVRFVEAGHVLGSASIEMTVDDGGTRKVIAFSGDVGPKGAPLLRDPIPIENADVVLLESTYGNREHKKERDTIDELERIIDHAVKSDGRVLIPAFAVGRTQQLIYFFGELERRNQLHGTNVVIDSPMAITATELYRRYRSVFDDDAWEIIQSGDSPLRFKHLAFSRTADDSKSLNRVNGGIIIISASGMCTAGRILHHLRHSIGQERNHVVFCGYQAHGTLGRDLVEGKKRVRIFGDWYDVRAQVHTLGGFSAHAGQRGLMDWADAACRGKQPEVILTHGENDARRALASKIRDDLGPECKTPMWGDTIEL